VHKRRPILAHFLAVVVNHKIIFVSADIHNVSLKPYAYAKVVFFSLARHIINKRRRNFNIAVFAERNIRKRRRTQKMKARFVHKAQIFFHFAGSVSSRRNRIFCRIKRRIIRHSESHNCPSVFMENTVFKFVSHKNHSLYYRIFIKPCSILPYKLVNVNRNIDK